MINKNLFFLEFILTRKCNKKCYYCNVFKNTKYKDYEPVIVDTDFLKYSLDCHPTNLYVQFCGGEPGIIENLDDVFKIVYDHKSVREIEVLSNGLIRKKNYDWLDKVKYYEHLVFDIVGKDVYKFYDELEFDEKYNYVFVSTEKTVKSLNENFKYFKKEGFFRKNFWHKIMNPKTHSIEGFKEDARELFKKIGDKNTLKMIESIIKHKKYEVQRKRCSMNPQNPTVDFETKEYVHCAAYLMPSVRVELNPKNALKNMKCDLFPFADYCKTCYVFDTGDKKKCISDSKKGKYVNKSCLLSKRWWF